MNTSKNTSYRELIHFVEDRPGHDKRYAIDNNKLKSELGWEQKYSFNSGLRSTVYWYLKNIQWCKDILKKSSYNLDRLGLRR